MVSIAAGYGRIQRMNYWDLDLVFGEAEGEHGIMQEKSQRRTNKDT